VRIWLASMGMSVGGAEQLVIALAHGFMDRGHQVLVSGPAGPLDADLPAGIERMTLPGRGRSPLGVAESALRLRAGMRRFRPDSVHASNVRVTVEAGAAARLAFGPRRPPVIATFQGIAAGEYRAAARLFRAADHVACVSEDLAAGMRAQGFPPARLSVIHNVARPPVAPAQDLGARPLVAAVGRLVPQKNHRRLLDAIALVPEAHLLIVGDGPLRGEIEARVRELGLGDRVRLAGLRLDAPAIIAGADLLVFSSDWEGQAVAALEALAAGTPVVSTPAHGMTALLASGAGLVAPSMEAADLAACIREVLADPARRAAMGEAGRALVAERHALPVVLDAYERLYVSGGRG
jgi:glycosyltransferase involved in cell wall biosynthesis